MSTAAKGSRILYTAIIPVLLTWSLTLLSFAVPVIDSTRPPYCDLTGNSAEIFYWIAESAGRYGAPLIAIILSLLLVSRKDACPSRKWRELACILVIGALFAAGGALFNEHVIKNTLKIPRPNIVFLAGTNGNGPLGVTPEQFYGIGKKKVRRKPLSDVLNKTPKPIPLSPRIEKHWIAETGYSFPSGHSYSAMFIATYYTLLAFTLIKSKWRIAFYLLLPWALAVCYSRPILRVHTPFDITAGSLLGIAAATFAWLLFQKIIDNKKGTHES